MKNCVCRCHVSVEGKPALRCVVCVNWTCGDRPVAATRRTTASRRPPPNAMIHRAEGR